MTTAQAVGAASHTTGGFIHRRASWPQTCIEKVLFCNEMRLRPRVFLGGVIERSSRMKGNFQVRFLARLPRQLGTL